MKVGMWYNDEYNEIYECLVDEADLDWNRLNIDGMNIISWPVLTNNPNEGYTVHYAYKKYFLNSIYLGPV